MSIQSSNTIEVVLTFGAYLKELKAQQKRNPSHLRRQVPTYEEVAEMVGVHKMTVYKMANGYSKRLSLRVAYAVIRSMRGLGFDMQVKDIVYWATPNGDSESLPKALTFDTRLDVLLGQYLADLTLMQEDCPVEEQRTVPTKRRLAKVAGVSLRTIQRLLASDVQMLDIAVLQTILCEFAACGHYPSVEQILLYQPK